MHTIGVLVCFVISMKLAKPQKSPWTPCHLQYGGECRNQCHPREVNLGLPYCGTSNNDITGLTDTCCVGLPCWYLGGICRRDCIPIYETSYDLPTTCPEIRSRCCMTEDRYRDVLANTPAPRTTTPTSLVTTTTTALPTQKTRDIGNCGIPRVTNLTASLDSIGPCSIPWVVSLRTTFSRHYCSGVLVSNNTVLTVAGCVVGIDASQLILTMGEYDVVTTESTEFAVRVSSITSHPLYHVNGRGFNVAVIKIRENLEDTCMSPVCLPGLNTSPVNLGYGRCLIAGWGDNAARRLSVRPVRVYNSEACTELMYILNINDTLPPDVICSLEEEPVPSGDCKVDGGSMLICPDLNDRYFLFGLVSEYTCVRHSISLYTDISYNSQWILRHSRRNA